MAKTAEQMAQEILDVCSGQPSGDAHTAMVQAFAVHIGGLWFHSGKTAREAQDAIVDAAAEINDQVISQWGDIKQATSH